jgi:hypothetical protein
VSWRISAVSKFLLQKFYPTTRRLPLRELLEDYGDPTNDAPLRDALQSMVLETKDLVEIIEYLVLEQNHTSDVSEKPSAVPSKPASGMLEAPRAVPSQTPSDVSNAPSSVPSQSQWIRARNDQERWLPLRVAVIVSFLCLLFSLWWLSASLCQECDFSI